MTAYEHLLDLDEDDDLPPAKIELEKIPRRLWEDALAPLASRHRASIACRVRDVRLRDLALRLAAELDMAECRLRIAAAEGRFNARRWGGVAPLPSAPGTAVAASHLAVAINAVAGSASERAAT